MIDRERKTGEEGWEWKRGRGSQHREASLAVNRSSGRRDETGVGVTISPLRPTVEGGKKGGGEEEEALADVWSWKGRLPDVDRT